MAKCAKVKADGERCTADVSDEGSFCLFHDPARKAEAQVARRKGAAATNRKRRSKFQTVDPDDLPPPPQTVEDAVEWASWAVWAVASGEIDGRTAHEVGYVLRAFMDGKKHVDQVSERVQELQAHLARLKEAS